MTTRLLLLLVACGGSPQPRPTNVVDHDLDVPVHHDPPPVPPPEVPILIAPPPPSAHAESLGPADDPGLVVTDALAAIDGGPRACMDRAARLRPIAERARTLVAAGVAADDPTHDRVATQLATVSEALDAIAADCRKKRDRSRDFGVFDDLRRSLAELFGS